MKYDKAPTFILTADDSLMLNFRNGLYSSYLSCLPAGKLAETILKGYCRRVELHPDGRAKKAPLALRILEAILHMAGFKSGEYATAPRYSLKRLVGKNTKVIAVSTIDPEGLGPLTRTLRLFHGDEPYTVVAFRQLMDEIKALKEKYKHLKVVVGGAGAWQLSSERLLEKYGIDHLVVGEAENVIPALFKSLAAEEAAFPRIIRGTPANVKAIPHILDATIGGLVEVSRGCGRGCSWCFSSAFGNMRCIPVETIKRSIEANIKRGEPHITLQSDDILLYRAKSGRFIPDADAVLSLLKELYSVKDVKSIIPIHFSAASVAADPTLIHKLTILIRERSHSAASRKLVVQVGIETGSPRLIERYMRGKALPFSPAEWPEVVKEALKALNMEGWFCYGTVIFGFPEEDEEDMRQTIQLIRDLKNLKIALIPLLYTRLNREEIEREDSKEKSVWRYLPLLHEIEKHNEKPPCDVGRPLNSQSLPQK